MKKLSLITFGCLLVLASCDLMGNTSNNDNIRNANDTTNNSSGTGGSTTTWEDLTWTVADKDVATYTTKTIIGRVILYATTNASIVVDANTKTIDNLSFNYRCKLGGTGYLNTDDVEQSYRVLAIPVTKNSLIKIYAQSGTSIEDRELKLSNLSGSYFVNGIAPGSTIAKVIETTYTGDESTLYVYSMRSGINIYGIYVNKQ
ncbi:hypothetical protein [Gracilinema caldarium]|uniref:Lipoprotein n=1 Tax=Gracilinema caldarium (strain ATCC 51460 / DSM 7334 / H1) TaxID=744872 RepID=F8EY65_GRAC1|nr:hypothetical protein [Gracilinema caldarium]AEJ18224.1 hypothetical protein Spica_0052 [Gracilinema caldarium DSM 7334]